MDPDETIELSQDQAPAPQSYEELAGRLEAVLLDPLAGDSQVVELCREAAGLGLAAVFVRPCDLELAVTQLKGSGVAPGSVCGYPHGWSTTAVKMFEIRDLLRRGAREILAAAPAGRLVSRQFQAVESEVLQMARACREEGAKFRLLLDHLDLTEDLKVIGMKIAKRCEADFVQAALEPAPSLWAAVPMYRKILKWFCGLSLPVPEESLDSVLRLYGLDAARIQCRKPSFILAAWRQRLQQQARPGAADASSE